MSASRTMMIGTLVRPYYRQNTSFFLFLIILMFSFSSLVSHDPLQYHYHLILGMLQIRAVFLMVFFAWFIYLAQCARFVIFLLQDDPRYHFLNMLRLAGNGKAFCLLLLVQLWLSLPISSYSLAITGVAIYRGWWGMAILVPAYILVLCGLGACWCLFHLRHPGRALAPWPSFNRIDLFRRIVQSAKKRYWHFFTGYILHERKSLFMGIKIFSCGALYLLLKDLGPDDYDLRMPILFYSFGIFTHGVLIYRFRELEENRLVFYQGLPVTLSSRFGQYGLLYFLLFIPELLTIICLLPRPLYTRDAISFAAYGYSLLLLLNSILFAGALKMGEYVRLIFIIFLLQYGFVLADALTWLTALFVTVACCLFFRGYYLTSSL
jgi:hypothetical protein